MPKLKTRKSASKRFKITGTGKILRRGRGIRHLLEHLSTAQKRKRKRKCRVNESDLSRVKAMLPYGG